LDRNVTRRVLEEALTTFEEGWNGFGAEEELDF
jgi:hypothetical protein